MSEQKADQELEAIQQIIKALEGLDDTARSRVISYVFQRLGLGMPAQTIATPTVFQSPGGTMLPLQGAPAGTSHITDIRSLKESKAPKSDGEMAALVAYYLKHHAPPEERKDSIQREDIEKYFTQANFPLPKRPEFTLPNAKNAGYFDVAEKGFYKLNPVGHNLIAHGLSEPRTSGSRSKNGAKKKSNSKKTVRKTK
ncbi:MAG: hypothetical protein PHY43_03340 [Verrucomicrobiales bacterium]|nr:hypothetical protein [Verrucomicrobiales bacterium]